MLSGFPKLHASPLFPLGTRGGESDWLSVNVGRIELGLVPLEVPGLVACLFSSLKLLRVGAGTS